MTNRQDNRKTTGRSPIRNCILTCMLFGTFATAGCGVEVGQLLAGYLLFGPKGGTGGTGGGGVLSETPGGTPVTAPSAADLNVATNEDAAVSITVVPQDEATAAILAQLSVTVTAGPAHGTASFDSNTKTATYTPASNFNGSDHFGYQICNNASPPSCTSATVFITVNAVNDAPNPVGDEYDVTVDVSPVTINGNVLGNDTDIDSAALLVSQVDYSAANVNHSVSGDYGILTMQADGTFTYTVDDTRPAVRDLPVGHTVHDIFEYSASDGSLSSSTTLTIHVHAPEGSP